MTLEQKPGQEQEAEKVSRKTLPLWLTAAPVLFVLFWSGGYTGVKVGLDAIEPITFLAVRYMGVLAILVPAFLILRPPLPRSPRAWLNLLVVGALVQGCYFGLTNIAAKLGVTAAGLGIVLAFQPIIVALLAPALAKEPVGLKVWGGLALGLVGAAITIYGKAHGADGPTVSGLLAASLALCFITAGTLYEKRFGEPHHLVTANVVQSGAALALALPIAVMTEDISIHWTPSFALALGYLVIFNSIIAMTLLFALVRHGAVSRASVLFFLVPPISALIAWIVLGEPMPALAWLGMAFAAAGVLIVRPTYRTD